MKLNRAQLEAQLFKHECDSVLARQAIQSLAIDGSVHWSDTRENYRVGTCQLSFAHGGIVLVQYRPANIRPFTDVHYVDEWVRTVRRNFSTASPVGAALRDLADYVEQKRDRQLRLRSSRAA